MSKQSGSGHIKDLALRESRVVVEALSYEQLNGIPARYEEVGDSATDVEPISDIEREAGNVNSTSAKKMVSEKAEAQAGGGQKKKLLLTLPKKMKNESKAVGDNAVAAKSSPKTHKPEAGKTKSVKAGDAKTIGKSNGPGNAKKPQDAAMATVALESVMKAKRPKVTNKTKKSSMKGEVASPSATSEDKSDNPWHQSATDSMNGVTAKKVSRKRKAVTADTNNAGDQETEHDSEPESPVNISSTKSQKMQLPYNGESQEAVTSEVKAGDAKTIGKSNGPVNAKKPQDAAMATVTLESLMKAKAPKVTNKTKSQKTQLPYTGESQEAVTSDGTDVKNPPPSSAGSKIGSQQAMKANGATGQPQHDASERPIAGVSNGLHQLPAHVMHDRFLDPRGRGRGHPGGHTHVLFPGQPIRRRNYANVGNRAPPAEHAQQMAAGSFPVMRGHVRGQPRGSYSARGGQQSGRGRGGALIRERVQQTDGGRVVADGHHQPYMSATGNVQQVLKPVTNSDLYNGAIAFKKAFAEFCDKGGSFIDTLVVYAREVANANATAANVSGVGSNLDVSGGCKNGSAQESTSP